MFNPQKLSNEIKKLGLSEGAINLAKNAILQADQAGDHYWRAEFRFMYIDLSIWSSDNFIAVITFPELMKIYDEHLEIQDKMHYHFMLSYKWFLEATKDYYQVSKADMENYFEAYKKRCKEYGYSLRAYYMKKFDWFIYCDFNKAREYFNEYTKCEKDSNCDGDVCEMGFESEYELTFGNHEKALKISQPILTGEVKAGEEPQTTYREFAKHHLRQGELDSALYYANLGVNSIGISERYIEFAGLYLKIFALTDMNLGIDLFHKYIHYFKDLHNPKFKYGFAKGAYLLFKTIEQQLEYINIPLPASLGFVLEESGYKTAKISEYFYDCASKLAELFDKRNESTYYFDNLNNDYKGLANNFFTDNKQLKYYGLVGKEPSVLATYILDDSTFSMDAILSNFESSQEIQVITSSIIKSVLCVTFEIDKIIYKAEFYTVDNFKAPIEDFYYEPSAEEIDIVNSNEKLLMCNMIFEDNSFTSIRNQARLLKIAMPNLKVVIDITRQILYKKIHFEYIIKYKDYLNSDFLVSISTLQDENNQNKVSISTLGLKCFGFRELFINCCDIDKLQQYCNIIIYTAKAIIFTDNFVDEGEIITKINSDESNPIFATWVHAQNYFKNSDMSKNEISDKYGTKAILKIYKSVEDYEERKTDEITNLSDEFIEKAHLQYQSDYEFYRKSDLAKNTLDIFLNNYQKHKKAYVRFNYRLTDELANERGYGIDLMWLDVTKADSHNITGLIYELKVDYPDLHDGMEMTIPVEEITYWLIKLDNDNFISEECGFFLDDNNIL